MRYDAIRCDAMRSYMYMLREFKIYIVNAMTYHTMQHYAMQYVIIQCHAILYNIIIHYITIQNDII